MWVKIQNFLFLLCCAFIGKFLYASLLTLIVFWALSNNWYEVDYYIPYLQGILSCFYPLAIVVGLVNLVYTRFALYIYQAICLKFPKLQWYALFLGWMLLGKEFLTEIQLLVLLLVGCIVASLCDKKHSLRQRTKIATVFFVMLISFLSGYFL